MSSLSSAQHMFQTEEWCTCGLQKIYSSSEISLLDIGKGKGKVHAVTGYKGPEVGYRHSSILCLTSALDGGGWSLPPGCFTPEKDPLPTL
jgi:hypothetical protein